MIDSYGNGRLTGSRTTTLSTTSIGFPSASRRKLPRNASVLSRTGPVGTFGGILTLSTTTRTLLRTSQERRRALTEVALLEMVPSKDDSVSPLGTTSRALYIV